MSKPRVSVAVPSSMTDWGFDPGSVESATKTLATVLDAALKLREAWARRRKAKRPAGKSRHSNRALPSGTAVVVEPLDHQEIPATRAFDRLVQGVVQSHLKARRRYERNQVVPAHQKKW